MQLTIGTYQFDTARAVPEKDQFMMDTYPPTRFSEPPGWATPSPWPAWLRFFGDASAINISAHRAVDLPWTECWSGGRCRIGLLPIFLLLLALTGAKVVQN